MSRVKATVLSDASAEPLVLGLLPVFAAATGISAEDARQLHAVVAGLVSFTLDNAYPDDDFGEIEVTLEADADVVHVTVHDWGLPLTSAGGDFGRLPEPLDALLTRRHNRFLHGWGIVRPRGSRWHTRNSEGDDLARLRARPRQPRHRVKPASSSTAPKRIEGIACRRVVGGTPPPAWDGSESQVGLVLGRDPFTVEEGREPS